MNEIRILTYLAGVRRFLANVQAEAAALAELGLATRAVGYEMATTTKRSWLMNQSLFTARRLAYGVTLGLIGAGVAALKLGNDYNRAMQEARVALRPFFADNQQLESTLNRLYNIAAITPFQVKDMTLAFRALYPSLHGIGITADETVNTLSAVIDALSVAGRVTPSALNRVSVALQHIAFQGRLTGMSVLQLARDGIPIYAILRKELGLTGEQMHAIGKLNIPASTALKAIRDYINTTPGYSGAAARLAQNSVQGLWSTFKDYVAKASGLAQKTLFASTKSTLKTVDAWFVDIFHNYDRTHSMIKAIDASVSPKTHAFAIIVNQLRSGFHDLWTIFKAFIGTIMHSRALWGSIIIALGILRGIIYIVAHTTFLWTTYLKILIPYLILSRFWTLGVATAEFLYWTTVRLSILWQFRYAKMMRVLNALKKAYILLTVGEIAAEDGRFVKFSRLDKMLLKLRGAWIAMGFAELFAMGPIGWIVAALVVLVGVLVILYFRWNRFHDAVNRLAKFLYAHQYILSFVPIFGPMLVALITAIKYWRTFTGWIQRAAHWLGKIHTPHIGLPKLGFHLPYGLASGGTTTTAGSVMVGERGPEILSLPRGAQVTPLSPVFSRKDIQEGRTTVIKLVVDGRTLSEIVARHQTDVNARG
jgi:hypothetical protein